MNFKKTLASLIAVMAMLLMILGTSPASAVESDGAAGVTTQGKDSEGFFVGLQNMFRGISPFSHSAEYLDVSVETTHYSVDEVNAGDSVTAYGTWDARHLDPKPGDMFRISVWENLGMLQGQTFSLDGTSKEGLSGTWAQCEFINSHEADCTFTDLAGPHEEIYGEWEFEVVARAAGSTDKPPLTILPGSVELEKSGTIPSRSTVVAGVEHLPGQYVEWTVDITVNSPESILSEPLILTDTFSANQKICVDAPETLDSNGLKKALDFKATSFLDLDYALELVDGQLRLVMEDLGDDSSYHSYEEVRMKYILCTSSGERDPKGMLYINEVSGARAEVSGARAEVEMLWDSWGTGTGDKEPQPSETPEPSPEPTVTPDETPEPTVTPEPTPTSTVEPTVTPSETPEPTVTPEPAPEPTPAPTVEPVVEKKQLAATGANTVWAAVAGLVLLAGGVGIAVRSRLRASGFDTTA